MKTRAEILVACSVSLTDKSSLTDTWIIKCIKRMCVFIKRTDVFYTLMDKSNRTLVSARCKGVNERLGPEF